MKPIILNKNSIHYKLATNFGGYCTYSDNVDICTYTRKVLLGAFLLLFVSTGAFALCAPIICFLVACVVSLIMGVNVLDDIAYIGGIFLALPTFGILIFWTSKRLSKVKVIKEDNFINVAYKSIKGKYCVKIEFVK